MSKTLFGSTAIILATFSVVFGGLFFAPNALASTANITVVAKGEECGGLPLMRIWTIKFDGTRQVVSQDWTVSSSGPLLFGYTSYSANNPVDITDVSKIGVQYIQDFAFPFVCDRNLLVEGIWIDAIHIDANDAGSVVYDIAQNDDDASAFDGINVISGGALLAPGMVVDDGAIKMLDNGALIFNMPNVFFQCGNGVDDDGDGKIDFPNDPGCSSPNDNSEQDTITISSVTPPPSFFQCSDGSDNNNNGMCDFAGCPGMHPDPGCFSADDDSESGFCPKYLGTTPLALSSGDDITLNFSEAVSGQHSGMIDNDPNKIFNLFPGQSSAGIGKYSDGIHSFTLSAIFIPGPNKDCYEGDIKTRFFLVGNLIPSVCGNGTILPPEECDDGNLNNGDGCGGTSPEIPCTVEPGWTCTGTPSKCTRCGNGKIESPETCDDGNRNNLDGCSSQCIIESGWTCTGTPKSTCTQPPPSGGTPPVPVLTGGLVPCGRSQDDLTTTGINEHDPCNFCHFFVLFDRIVDFLLAQLMPVIVVLLVAWGGFLMMISRDNPGQVRTGREIVTWALIGYGLMLMAWLIVNTFFSVLGIVNWEGIGQWWNISCQL